MLNFLPDQEDKMRSNVPVCPECKKEVPPYAARCHHCSKYISAPGVKSVVSWPWMDRIFLVSFVFIFASFFLPWLPGQFLFREDPLSPFFVLLHLIDLEVDFLESYNILRMVLMVPIFSLVLFFMVYMGDKLRITPFPGLSLIICILVSAVVFISKTFQGLSLWVSLLAFLALFAYFLKRFYKDGSLGRVAYYLLFIFVLASIFLYLGHLFSLFYARLDAVHLYSTWGFYLVWFLTGTLLVVSLIHPMRTAEDFWIILFGIAFSYIAYSALVHPVFVSGPARFVADNLPRMTTQLLTHIRIVGIALIISIAAGVPIGVYITRHPSAAGFVLYISSILITIPSIAMFGFMMPILSSIDKSWDAVNGIGIGVVPAIVALALYSLLPIIRNTYIALKNVDPATVEAGRGMGMTGFQLLIQLQLPLSAPIIMAGVRTAVVMGIAIAAIAAYIGAGGLGLFVSEGLEMSTNDSVIAGAIAMSFLAILADIFLAKAEDWVTPSGLKVKQAAD